MKNMESKNSVSKNSVIEVSNFSFQYGSNLVLDKIDFQIKKNIITAIIGPSGCGKSTLLRCFNRMNDFAEDWKHSGEIFFENDNILDKKVDSTALRKKIGMVFQKPTPFPKSIYENIAYGLKVAGKYSKTEIDSIVQESLQKVGLWKEVKDRLKETATKLSGGQTQRLCIARTIAVSPKVILMDEPTSALDPNSTQVIEALIKDLSKSFTIIIVTHNMQQAMRISQETAFLYIGKLIEFDKTNKIFRNPKEKLTKNYITGKIG